MDPLTERLDRQRRIESQVRAQVAKTDAKDPITGESLQEILSTQVTRVSDRQLNIPEFVASADPVQDGARFRAWIGHLKRLLNYKDDFRPSKALEALDLYGGEQIRTVLEHDHYVDIIEQGETENEFEYAVRRLEYHFIPRAHRRHARYQFWNEKFLPGETLLQFNLRMSNLLQASMFNDPNDMMVDKLIQEMPDDSLRQKALEQDMDLPAILKAAHTRLAVLHQNKDIAGGSSHVNKITKEDVELDSPCKACTYTCHFKGKCPAKNSKCSKCKRYGHYTSACYSKTKYQKNHKGYKGKGKGKGKKRYSRAVHEDDSSSSSDEEESISFYSKSIKIKKTKESQEPGILLPVKIEGFDFQMDPDSGSDINVLGKEHFRMLCKKLGGKPRLFKVKDNVFAANNTLINMQGRAVLEIASRSKAMKKIVYIMADELKSAPLLGEKTLLDLGLMKYSPEGEFANVRQVKLPKSTNEKVNKLIEKYSHLFEGIGKFKDCKVKLKLKPGAVPVQHSARPVSLHLEEKLKRRLDAFVDMNVMEWLTADEPLGYVSRLVAVPKPNKPDEVRITGDFRDVNRDLSRTRLIENPRIEDFIKTMNGNKFWFKLDVRHGYHQMELDEESRKLTTMCTKWGNIRYTRVPMGIKNAQDYFDEQMTMMLSHCERTKPFRDDLLGGGRDEEEFLAELEKVFKAADEKNVRFDPSKCDFGIEEMTFLGYKFTKEGVKPDPKKVAALKAAKRPETKEALLSFICMVGWNERFIQRFSEETAILRDLANQPGTMTWTDEHENAFQRVKNALSEDTLLHFFKKGAETGVFVDAGKKAHEEGKRGGFCGILAQKIDGKWQPIHFASRRMTDVESRWGQTELEARAVRWALTEKFRYYLEAAPHFTVYTDAKSLIPMWKKPSNNTPMRITQQILATQHLDFSLVYREGKSNPADFCSRNPIPCEDTNIDEVSDDLEKLMVKMINRGDEPELLDMKEQTARDAELQFIKERILRGDWSKFKHDKKIKPFYGIRHELAMTDGLVTRGTKIVVPRESQHKVARATHKLGHQGQNRSIALSQEHFWFPGMTAMVKDAVDRCPVCQVTTPDYRTEPLKMEPLPKNEFDKISVDFKGPFRDGKYALVFLDLRSRWPDVCIVSSTAFKTVKKAFDSYFATYGTPRVIKSDNGPPFNGYEWKDYAKMKNFTARFTTPRHPEANGEIENFMKNIGKAIKRATLMKTDYGPEIVDMIRAYRATPHPTTGVSPYELLFKRKMRLGELCHQEHGTSDKKKLKIEDRVQEKKEQSKKYHDSKRNVKKHDFRIGDIVLVNPEGEGFLPNRVTIIGIKGSTIVARTEDGKQIKRDSSHFKHWLPEYEESFTVKTQLPQPPRPASPPTQPSPPSRRQTRSRGPAPDLPNVMKAPIERSAQERGRFQDIIDNFPKPSAPPLDAITDNDSTSSTSSRSRRSRNCQTS